MRMEQKYFPSQGPQSNTKKKQYRYRKHRLRTVSGLNTQVVGVRRVLNQFYRILGFSLVSDIVRNTWTYFTRIATS